MINSTYSSSLTNQSLIYNRLNEDNNSYYYQLIELNVDTNGLYRIQCISQIFVYAYLYNNTFDRLNPSINLITFDYDTISNPNLSFSSELNVDNLYQLLITTVNPLIIGSFEIIVSGPGQTTFSSITLTTTTTGNYSFLKE